jgi:hypothetical protein
VTWPATIRGCSQLQLTDLRAYRHRNFSHKRFRHDAIREPELQHLLDLFLRITGKLTAQTHKLTGSHRISYLVFWLALAERLEGRERFFHKPSHVCILPVRALTSGCDRLQHSGRRTLSLKCLLDSRHTALIRYSAGTLCSGLPFLMNLSSSYVTPL